MPSPQHMPQNGDEAAYLSFALLDALSEQLVILELVDQHTLNTVYATAAMVLEKTPNAACSRASDFLWHSRLQNKGFKKPGS